MSGRLAGPDGANPSPRGESVVEVVVGFARTLRVTGVDASPQRVQAMVEALGYLDVLVPRDVYWAGRLTLCGGPDDVAWYDRVFAAYFSGERPPPPVRRPVVEVTRPIARPDSGSGDGDEGEDRDLSLAATASDVEVLRQRDVSRLSEAERAEVRRLITLLDPGGPVRRSRRFRPAHRGPLDIDRTVRATLRRGGEPARLLRHARRVRPRRLVLLIDVSGSMSPYADSLMRFAHAAARSRRGTEVFTMSTRLTRVTREMAARDPDRAIAAVAHAVPDWSGGTRLGELLKAFLDRWGQRGTARGAVVVIASDGWERGDARLLGEQMARLSRLAHRVVWVNPHKGRAGYEPLTRGMAAALPYVGDFVAGHSLGALERLCQVLSRGRDGASLATRGDINA